MDDEIITLHIGNFANYVGAHMRSIQHNLTLSDNELTDPSVYQMSNDVQTPRCVAVDMFENIGNYPTELQSDGRHCADWNGRVAKTDVIRGSRESWTDTIQVMKCASIL